MAGVARSREGNGMTAASAPKRSMAQAAEVLAMTPQDALMELEVYVSWSAEKRAFGKTRAQAALAVLKRAVA